MVWYEWQHIASVSYVDILHFWGQVDERGEVENCMSAARTAAVVDQCGLCAVHHPPRGHSTALPSFADRHGGNNTASFGGSGREESRHRSGPSRCTTIGQSPVYWY